MATFAYPDHARSWQIPLKYVTVPPSDGLGALRSGSSRATVWGAEAAALRAAVECCGPGGAAGGPGEADGAQVGSLPSRGGKT